MAAGLNIGELFIRMSADVSALRKDMADAQNTVASGAKAIGNTLKTLGLAFSVGLAVRKFINETTEAQNAQAQLAARIKATGGAAGRTIDQLNEMAGSLQETTTFGDEAVNSVQALLLTFDKIKGDTFDRATKDVLDMATALGKDATGAATQLGKALQDPVKGLTALSKIGVQFTQAEKDQIKAMVEAGKAAEAQALIL